jgi:hypothetical protein
MNISETPEHSPMHPAVDALVDPLVEHLRDNAAKADPSGMVRMIIGVVITLLSIFIITTLLRVMMWLWFDGSTLLTLLVQIVLLGGAGALMYFKSIAPAPAYPIAPQYFGQPLLNISVIDWLLTGPRLFVTGFRHGKSTDLWAQRRFLDRCALLLRQLADHGEAVAVSTLIIGEDDAMMVQQLLDYLDTHNWIGHSSDRTRVWLSSGAKNKLPTLGVKIGRHYGTEK